MENCLVTKLKATVNNDNLVYLTKIKIEVSDNENASVDLFAANASLWTCQGNCYFTDSEDTVNYGQSRENVNSVRLRGSGVVFVENKYMLGRIYLGRTSKVSTNVSKILPYVTEGEQDYFQSSAYGNITGIKTNATILLCSENISGDATYLVTNSPNLTRIQNDASLNLSLDLSALEGKSIQINAFLNVYGDFDYLANLTNYSFGTRYYDQITGSIEGYVAKALSLGKTSGTFTWTSNTELRAYSNVKYNGVGLNVSTDIPNSATKFSWDAQGNITWS